MPGRALLHGQAAAAAEVRHEAPVPQAVQLADVEEAGELSEQAGEQRAAAAPLACEEQHLDVAGLLGRHVSSLAFERQLGTRRVRGRGRFTRDVGGQVPLRPAVPPLRSASARGVRVIISV